ncbi:MAG: SulP family inorganic anion transporter, partial [Lachnospiraceae bacterium]|nr:SulP family inorganic anion transporter [Lachnospiraceae bacterium]
YGSLLPILIYSLITTSPQFIIGVDAMPAAMVGTLLTTLSVQPESQEALTLVPLISFIVGLWFILFYYVKAGRVIRFISTPVMGGFISGVGATIILMQIPKLYGGKPASGELFDLLKNITQEITHFNLVSFLLGIGTIAIIFLSKHYIPRVPMTAIMVLVGALLQIIFHLDQYGVALLPAVPEGLPPLLFPDFFALIHYNFFTIAMESLSIALVIMAQTLLATKSYAAKYQDTIDENQELLAYGGMNFAASLIGCCPINGSVSRSGIADFYQGKSQIISLAAAVTMAVALCVGTPFLQYLPVPILTAIVISALIGIIDWKMFCHLLHYSRSEAMVFLISFFAVLLFGTINGVIIGCLLSFGEITMRGVDPPATFLGRIPGHGNFHTLGRNKHAYPIKNTIIYRFQGNLFFANVSKLEYDIERSIKPDTRQVVVDARCVGNIDITALDRIKLFRTKLEQRGIRFYITEHDSSLNDHIRELGGEELITSGVIRRTITLALSDAGLEKPYDLDIPVPPSSGGEGTPVIEASEELTEKEWAYGGHQP